MWMKVGCRVTLSLIAAVLSVGLLGSRILWESSSKSEMLVLPLLGADMVYSGFSRLVPVVGHSVTSRVPLEGNILSMSTFAIESIMVKPSLTADPRTVDARL